MKKFILLLAYMVAIYSCKTQEQSIGEELSGVQLWYINCSRCHNIPDPTDYSDAQWEVVSSHMKVKANLTLHDMNEIQKFLKSAN